MNITEMRLLLRRDLRDTDPAGYRWTDEELDRHLLHAVQELSDYLPLEQNSDLATVAGSREVDISSLTDRICIEAVEYPAGLFPASLPHFRVWGDTLTLTDGALPDGSTCRIYWGKLHTLDSNGSTVPSRYNGLLIAGAAGFAATSQGVGTINRVNTGGTQTPRDWAEWGEQRLAFFYRELRRLGRKNRVRVRRFYLDAEQTEDTE